MLFRGKKKTFIIDICNHKAPPRPSSGQETADCQACTCWIDQCNSERSNGLIEFSANTSPRWALPNIWSFYIPLGPTRHGTSPAVVLTHVWSVGSPFLFQWLSTLEAKLHAAGQAVGWGCVLVSPLFRSTWTSWGGPQSILTRGPWQSTKKQIGAHWKQRTFWHAVISCCWVH